MGGGRGTTESLSGPCASHCAPHCRPSPTPAPLAALRIPWGPRAGPALLSGVWGLPSTSSGWREGSRA